MKMTQSQSQMQCWPKEPIEDHYAQNDYIYLKFLKTLQIMLILLRDIGIFEKLQLILLPLERVGGNEIGAEYKRGFNCISDVILFRKHHERPGDSR